MDKSNLGPDLLAPDAIGATRVITFGVSNVAPAAAVVAGLVIVVSHAGFASPLVVVIAFVASACCASSIAEFARRLPSAGSLYTYTNRGLGSFAGFLTGWMVIFAYLMYLPAILSLTSQYAAQFLSHEVHVTVAQPVLFVIILALVVTAAYFGIRTSSSIDLVLVVTELAVIVTLAVTILVKAGPTHYSMAVFSPASTPHHQITDIANGMIYGITAFAGFDAVASLGEEARKPRRTIPASIIGVVIVTGACYLLVVLAETWGLGPKTILEFPQQANPLGFLATRYWSASQLWLIELVVVLTGLGFVITACNVAIRLLFAMGREQVLPASLASLSPRRTPVVAIGFVATLTLVLGLPLTAAYGGLPTFGYLAGAGGLSIALIYLAVNVAVIRAFRTEFRPDFRIWRHAVLPAVAAVLFLFPLWAILNPHSHQLVARLPFTALGWLIIGAITAVILKSRRPETFEKTGRVFTADRT